MVIGMGKAIATTYINFGLVNIPIRIETLARDESIKFNMLCPSHHKINHINYCQICQKSYDYSELLKGYQVEENKFVVFTKEQLEQLKEKTNAMRVLGFIEETEIPFLLFDTTYNITPQHDRKKGYIGLKSFVLFKEALKISGLCCIVKFTLKTKEHLGIIKVFQDRLFLTILHYPYEITISEKVSDNLTDEELELGLKLLESLKINSWADFYKSDNEEIKDKFKEKVLALVGGKSMEEVKTITTIGNSLKEQLEKSLELLKKKGS
jgi:DNA end-binding protein Ku